MVLMRKDHLSRLSCRFCDATFGCNSLKMRHTWEAHKKFTPNFSKVSGSREIKLDERAAPMACRICTFQDASAGTIQRQSAQCHFLRCCEVFTSKKLLQLHFEKNHAAAAQKM